MGFGRDVSVTGFMRLWGLWRFDLVVICEWEMYFFHSIRRPNDMEFCLWNFGVFRYLKLLMSMRKFDMNS